MDETRSRQQICQAAHQLWARGLIVGDGGVVTAELHRRRYLTTPAHGRRPNLQSSDVICVDMGGLNIQGGSGLNEAQWRVHRAAYKASLTAEGRGDATSGAAGGGMSEGMSGGGSGGAGHVGRLISATVLAQPPIVMAMLDGLPPRGHWEVNHQGPIPLVTPEDEAALIEALGHHPVAAVHGMGLLAATKDLDTALNWIERIDHAARIELAMGGRGREASAGDQPDQGHEPEQAKQPDNSDADETSSLASSNPASEAASEAASDVANLSEQHG